MSVAEDGFLQMVSEMCGAKPSTLATAIDVIERCAEAGQPVLGYMVLHYLANKRMIMQGSSFVVPRPLVPYIEALCLIRGRALESAGLSQLLQSYGYPKPTKQVETVVEETKPDQLGRSETRVSEVEMETVFAVVFVANRGGSPQLFPVLVTPSEDGSFVVEIPPPEIHAKLCELCTEMLKG